MILHRKVILTGFMGSGKSSIGNQLARRWNVPFHDLDKEIEIETGLTINEIFAKKGEGYFRDLELKSLKRLLDKNGPSVIAVGGGTICSKAAQSMIKNAYTVYLNVPMKILLGRLKHDRSQRPLVKDIPDEELSDWLESKLKEREKYYRISDLIIDPSKLTISQLASPIEDQLM